MPQTPSKPGQKMAVGFNHNVKYKGQVYHVQTEDSGVGNPHIITHLFVGGNILASKKMSYADLLKADDLEQVVRALMEEQHKEMLRNLVAGAYDQLEQGAVGRAFQPGQLAIGDAAGKAAPAPASPSPKPPEPRPSFVEPIAAALFADDLISEKSLDEVILSYLSGDKGQE
ncbi:MAG: hypothetical protein ACYCWW_02265 [Deltaproteobacteria bacterium]